MYAGRELELELYRVNSQCDKDEELEPIEVNRQYDFNYQQTTFLPRERKLYPVSLAFSLSLSLSCRKPLDSHVCNACYTRGGQETKSCFTLALQRQCTV